jgi:chromosome condensin MukBEF MukE localization factor
MKLKILMAHSVFLMLEIQLQLIIYHPLEISEKILLQEGIFSQKMFFNKILILMELEEEMMK